MLAAGRRKRDHFGVSGGFGPSGLGFRMVWSPGPLIIILSRGESVGLLWASVVRSSEFGLRVVGSDSIHENEHSTVFLHPGVRKYESWTRRRGRFEILKPQPYIGPEPYIP